MAFVKLDCGMLDSTLWVDRAARELFITALLMAEPRELKAPEPQIKVDCLDQTGFMVPPGWYGFVPAAGTGIIRRCGEMPMECGMEALRRLGEPEQDSRTPDHDGRRMVRVDGGYLILNYDKYRQKDYSAAERSKRYREKKKASRVANVTSRVTDRSVTQAEGEGEGYNPTVNPSPSRKRSKSVVSDPWDGLPPELNTPGFREAWEQYIAYRVKARLKKLLPESIKAQWRKLATYGPDVARIAIGDTIGNGWQGIFPEKVANGTQSSGPKLTGRAAEFQRQGQIHNKPSQFTDRNGNPL